jgi:diguanylate cyclase (GGDEF)-like protein
VGPVVYIPPIALVALAWGLDGTQSANAVGRYAFGLTGCLSAGLVFAHRARELTPGPHREMRWVAVAFLAYAVAAGIIVPTSSLWPAAHLNGELFLSATGVPIQVVRALLAGLISALIWRIGADSVERARESNQYLRHLRHLLLSASVSVAVTLMFGWIATQYLEDVTEKRLRSDNETARTLLLGTFDSQVSAVDAVLALVSNDPAVGALILAGAGANMDSAPSALNRYVSKKRAEALILVDSAGNVAAVAPAGLLTGEAEIEVFPVLGKVSAGPATRFLINDSTAKKIKYFSSVPIQNVDGSVIGHALFGRPVDMLEGRLKDVDLEFFIVDAQGAIKASNRQERVSTNLWPSKEAPFLDSETGLRPGWVIEKEVVGEALLKSAGTHRLATRTKLNASDWSLVVSVSEPFDIPARLGGIGLTFFAVIAVLSIHITRDRIVREAIRKDIQHALERRTKTLLLQATIDPLTGLHNRLSLNDALAMEIDRSIRHESSFSIIMFDVDHFKRVNDTHGHLAGDSVLVRLSLLAQNALRSSDLLARWGGEEFVVLLRDHRAEVASNVAQKLRATFALADFGCIGQVTCSFGVAEFEPGDSAETLVGRADAAMYQAKHGGRNRVAIAGGRRAIGPIQFRKYKA